MTKRKAISKATRRHVYIRDLGCCRYCGKIIWPWQPRHMAHEVAHANGGDESARNLALSCPQCNLRAGAVDMPPLQRMDTVTIIILAVVAILATLLTLSFII